MKKHIRLFQIYILLLIAFFIFFGIAAYCEIIGTKIIYVNNDNEAEITERLEDGEISINGELSSVACKQGLGDWTLYLQYEDGSRDSHFLDDGVAIDIHEYISEYISENGVVGGIKGEVSRYGAGICLIFVVPYSFYKLIMFGRDLEMKKYNRDRQ
ncbi:MAG: hypothetical protein LIO45_07845 [Clostridiales bacterium]|nr:hypothetical protein [Clostridiales bacterium]